MKKMGRILLEKATKNDTQFIWEILQEAIDNRKKDGSEQWQDGYPNLQTLEKDIENNNGFIIKNNDRIIAYAAIILNNEPAYDGIEGKWLTNGDFLVIHRVAVTNDFLGKGIATVIFNLIEDYAKSIQIPSIKVDTNFDNPAMLRILEKLNYHYCGEVYFRGSARKAFEKIINLN